jgi:RNA polymerase sigma factor (sigma-70 family)
MSQYTGKSLTKQAIRQAMAQHDGLVQAFIRRQGGGDITYEEALQAGRIGLWQAIRGYDPQRGTTFATYAWVAICRQVQRRVKELSRDRAGWLPEMPPSWVLPDPAAEVERQLGHDLLYELVGQLPERLGRVIVGRYGLAGQPPRTLQAIGQELGLTRERVRQLQQEALAWLRHPARSGQLRQWIGRNTAADYRQALAQNAAWRRSRRAKS